MAFLIIGRPHGITVYLIPSYYKRNIQRCVIDNYLTNKSQKALAAVIIVVVVVVIVVESVLSLTTTSAPVSPYRDLK